VFSVELTMTLPLVFVLLLALVEFAMLLIARQNLSHATYVGARRAAVADASAADVERAVRGVLSRRLAADLSLDVELGRSTGDVIRVEAVVPMSVASPDLLRWVGLSLRGRELRTGSVLRKE
jgi:Flp pilus assembly protein TadG